MNQFGHSNTNDLQKAIDEITGGSASAGAPGASDSGVGAVDGGAASSDASASDVANATAELENQIKGQMGVPPTPPTSGEGVPEMALPGVAGTASGSEVSGVPGASDVPGGNNMSIAGGVAAAPESMDGGVAAAPEMMAEGQNTVAAGGSFSPEMGGDLAKVRESALQELVPLMDKVDIPADERFNIYAEVIEATHDKSIVERAFEAAKGIADEKQKAESLLKLVKMIDTL